MIKRFSSNIIIIGISIALQFWPAGLHTAHKKQSSTDNNTLPIHKIVCSGKKTHRVCNNINTYALNHDHQAFLATNEKGQTPLSYALTIANHRVANALMAIQKVIPAYGNKCSLGFIQANTHNEASQLPAHEFFDELCLIARMHYSYHKHLQGYEHRADKYYHEGMVYRSYAYDYWILILEKITKPINPQNPLFDLKTSLVGQRDNTGKTWVDILQEKITTDLNNEFIGEKSTKPYKDLCLKAIRSYIQQHYGSSSLNKKALFNKPITKEHVKKHSCDRGGSHLHTPLHNACMVGNKQAIEMLKGYCKKTAHNIHGHLPIETAIICDRDDSLQHLLLCQHYTPDEMASFAPCAKLWNKKRAGKFFAYHMRTILLLKKIYGADVTRMILEYLS